MKITEKDLVGRLKNFHARETPHARMLIVPSISDIGMDWEVDNLKIVTK